MKKLFLIILFFLSLNAFGQTKQKIDSIYYLLDILKIPANDRMWEIKIDGGQYKYYSIQCQCLKFNGKPTFYHSYNDKGQIINELKLKSIKLSSLADLIFKSKQFLNKDTDKELYSFFLIEPEVGMRFIIHNVDLINPAINIVSGPDVIQTPPDTSAFKIKGLIKVEPKNIDKYKNQLVITSGRVVNTKVIKSSNTIFMYINADYPNEDFSIIITNENRDKFDAPEDYFKGKKMKVTGKVIDYNGKSAIVINDPSQIQLMQTK